MRKLLLLTLLLAFSATAFAQYKATGGASTTADVTPNTATSRNQQLPPSPQAFGDVQFNFDLTANALGNASAEYDGTYVWYGKWASNLMFRAKVTATTITVRDSFAIGSYTGATAPRDLAFDGKYMYGGVAAGAQIVRIDTGTKAVVKTITTTQASVRGIAWDPIKKGFWVCGFSGDIVCVDTNGAVITGTTISNTLVGKYGLAYDSYSTGGPFLWVFDQSATPSNVVLYKYNLSTLTQVSTFDVATISTLGAGSAPLAGGLYIANGIIPGKATLGCVVQGAPDRLLGLELATTSLNPLSAFNLQAPADNTVLTTSPTSTTPVTISWDTSATGATYKWVLQTPDTTGTRKLTIPSVTNSIATTLGALDGLLAAAGVAPGDSLKGKWSVWAFKVAGASGPDSLRSTSSRTITLKRQATVLGAFNLSSPANNAVVTTSPGGTTPITINWTKSGTGSPTYKWQFKAGATFTAPATLSFASNTGGYDTTLTLGNSQVDSLLAGLGVARGDSVTGQWRVYAYRTATDSLASTQTYTIKFKRAATTPLDQNFESGTFPPAEWTLDANGGATQYWKAGTVSAYGTGTGSAYYNFWTASSGTTQSLISNTFPAVTTGWKLRFNYAQAYYSGSADELDVYTSTNGGTNWTLFQSLIASTTTDTSLTSTTLSTVQGTSSQFVPTATQWATKQFSLPVGTNKVKFTALSAFGNDLFIDNIKAVPPPVGTPIGLSNATPIKFALHQNYPNPFNPTTQISFALPSSQKVTLKVYDIIGREVATLLNGEVKQAGSYTLNFNASKLASGMYFYRIQAGSFNEVKKMLLVK